MIRELLHKLAHWRDPATLPCSCALSAYQRGWRQRRDAEIREASLPASPDELDAWLRGVIADSESWRDVA